jgi:hypothetical protein
VIFEIFLSFLTNFSHYFGGFSFYLESGDRKGVSGLGVRALFEIFLFLFLSFFVKKVDSRAIPFFNISFFGILLFYIVKDFDVLSRAAYYFTAFKYLALPWFYSAFSRRGRDLYFFFIVLYSSAAYLRNLTSEQFVPYQNILFF